MKKQLCITALAIFGILTSNAQDSGDYELGYNSKACVSLHNRQIF